MAKSLYSLDKKTGEASLHLHSGQARVINSTARFVFMLAGTQSGKTSFGPWWLYNEIQARGAGDYLAVAPSYDLFKLKMLPEMLKVYGEVLGIGRYWTKDQLIELRPTPQSKFSAKRSTDPMWGRIILRSAAAPSGLESTTAQAAWLDEAGQDEFTVDHWEAVLRRLSLAQGRVLATTTLYNLGWIKQQVYEPWMAGDKLFDVIQFASVENPLFSQDEFERARRTMAAWKFAMFYLGQFSKPPGMIYSDYDEAVHKVPDRAIPSHWPRYVGIDPGAVHHATIWVAENPVTNCYYVYRESLEGDKTSDDHVQWMMDFAESENVVRYVGGAPSEKQFRTDYAAKGVYVGEPEVSDVEAGLDRVISLFKQKRLFIFESCKGLRDELGKYSREIDKSGTVTEEIKDKNKFHRLDALRYVATVLSTAVSWQDIMGGESGKMADMWGALRR